LDTTNFLPIVGLLALAVVVVILLLRFMRPRHGADARRPPAAVAEAVPRTPSSLTTEEQEYLDSSHILPAGRGPLDTRAEDWRKDKRK
jgi:hypothetical protein